MRAQQKAAVVLVLALATAPDALAQERHAPERAYLAAVAGYFKVPTDEVAILADWGLAADEVPVVLFVARQAGVSPEAVAALRRSGRGWSELSQRYGIGAAALHLPVRDEAPTGNLAAAYDRYRTLPVTEWRAIALSDQDVIALVNVRVIAQTLRLPAEEVIRHAGSAPTYVELFTRLRR